MMTIKQAGERFQNWRKTRRHKHCAVPTELRRLALAIKRRHGEKAAREALGLSAASLWNWQRHLSSARHPLGFIELKPPPARTPPLLKPLIVEWRRPDGASMKVSGDIESSEINRLARAFLGASP